MTLAIATSVRARLIKWLLFSTNTISLFRLLDQSFNRSLWSFLSSLLNTITPAGLSTLAKITFLFFGLVLFCLESFILFYFVLFCVVLRCFVLFCVVLFNVVLYVKCCFVCCRRVCCRRRCCCFCFFPNALHFRIRL